MLRFAFLPLPLLLGCTNDAELLDPCTSDDDCAPDYVCHLEDGDAEGVCWTCKHGAPDCEEPGGEHEDDTGMQM